MQDLLVWNSNETMKLRQLQLLAIVALLSAVQSLKYSAIKDVNGSCFPKDSCNNRKKIDALEEYNCDCNSTCDIYKTCCIDSPFMNKTRRFHRRTACISHGDETSSAFMINRCHNDYNGIPGIRRKCEDDTIDLSDPFAYAPMTDIETHITYKSLFCAICNFEKPQNLIPWQVMLECSSLGEFMNLCSENRDFILNNIMYIKEKEMWGLWSWNKKSDWKVRFLPIYYQLPELLKPYITPCRPDLTSDCLADWNNSEVKRLCKSYMGAVYFPNIAFRNVHCAICNRVKNFTDMSCHPIYSSPFRNPDSLSFGLLLDFDLKDGDKVGTIRKCEQDQVYDPFFKKCRTIECPLPGYKLKDGQCSKE